MNSAVAASKVHTKDATVSDFDYKGAGAVAYTGNDWSKDTWQDSKLYVMNIDGTGVTQLTNDPGNELQPAWSPDGTEIEIEIFIFQPKLGL